MDNDNTDYRTKMNSQIRDAFCKLVYTLTTHEKMANRLQLLDGRVKLWQLILSAITTAGLVGVFVFDKPTLNIVTTIVSFGLIFLNGYNKAANLSARVDAHKQIIHQLWLIRERYISLLVDFETLVDDEIRGKRDELTRLTSEIYSSAPRTDKKSYSEAQKALKEQEEQTCHDSEIDRFLPPQLRGKYQSQ